MKPKLFIGSSSESRNIAYASQKNLYNDAEVTVWDQGLFDLSYSALEPLLKVLDNTDFGMFVFSPDDLAIIRGEEKQIVRDNIIFELGLFIGRLGKERCFILIPDDDSDFHFPTDLTGINPAKYETSRSDGSLQAATAPACHSVREVINRLGMISVSTGKADSSPKDEEVSIEDELITKRKVKQQDDGAESDESPPKWFHHYIKKDYESALELLAEDLKSLTDPDEIDSLNSWHALIKYRINPKEGLLRFEELFDENPDNYLPYLFLADELLIRNQLFECIEYLDKGIEKAASKTILIRKKSQCLQQMGREEQALNEIKSGIEDIYPKSWTELIVKN